jgi:hypothetical protein
MVAKSKSKSKLKLKSKVMLKSKIVLGFLWLQKVNKFLLFSDLFNAKNVKASKSN